MFLHKNNGQSLIEILVVIAIMAIILPAILTGFYATREGKPQQQRRLRATELLQEAVEAMRIIREGGWSSIATDNTYYPQRAGNSWTLVVGQEIIDGITREIIIESVNRLNGTIVDTGGTPDPSTKSITVRASWTEPIPSAVESKFYLTRFMDNESYIQTTQADFESGSHTNTIVTNDSGGEVTLGAGGVGSWCAPELTITALDLPKNGVANALMAIEGKAFATTGDNASGVSFANVDITNAQPPVATIQGTFNGYKTNGVFGETDYAYIATDTNGEEVVIIDLATLTKSGFVNAPGIADGASVYVQGTVGYLVQGNKLYTFDLTSKSGSRPLLDSDGAGLEGNGTSVVVKGSYAFVTNVSSNSQLDVFNISDPNNITWVKSIQLGSMPARDVAIKDTGTSAYVVVDSSAGNEFYIVDTSNLPSLSIIGSYDTQGMSPKAVTVVTGNKAIVVGTNAEEYQVINITNESNPTRCGGLNIDSGVNDIASVLEADGDAYSYILTGDASMEFNIIVGGPGGAFATNGVYESLGFDPGYSTAFNRILPTFTTPPDTGIDFQIAIADAVSGSCDLANYIFVGPDGTNGTHFTADSPIPLDDNGLDYENPGRCMKYRAYLSTTSSNATPIFEEISINHAP